MAQKLCAVHITKIENLRLGTGFAIGCAMTAQSLKRKLSELENTVAQLKAAIATTKSSVLPVSDAIVAELLKEPLTIEEIAKRLRTTKAIANLATRKLANDGIVVLVSEPGKRVARFRAFIAANFPENYQQHYSKRSVAA